MSIEREIALLATALNLNILLIRPPKPAPPPAPPEEITPPRIPIRPPEGEIVCHVTLGDGASLSIRCVVVVTATDEIIREIRDRLGDPDYIIDNTYYWIGETTPPWEILLGIIPEIPGAPTIWNYMLTDNTLAAYHTTNIPSNIVTNIIGQGSEQLAIAILTDILSAYCSRLDNEYICRQPYLPWYILRELYEGIYAPPAPAPPEEITPPQVTYILVPCPWC